MADEGADGAADAGAGVSADKDWDARYRAMASPFGDGPSAWAVMALAHPGVAATAPAQARRTALSLADGDGRNGTWLARQGLAMTALDLSAEATARAVARDRAAGVTVTRLVADLLEWRPERRWDLVFLLFLQGPTALREAGLRAAAAAVAPGGWLVLEGFGGAPDEGPDALGPSRAVHRWQAAEIGGWAAPLVPREVVTGRLLLEDGPRHAGEGTVLRALLHRPPAPAANGV
ncbi:MAG: methyltransferase domain-containing protein [Pseudomonadota bacterium]